MKLVGLVFLGLVASFIAGLLFMLVVVKFFPNIEKDDAYLWVPVFIIMPIAFFAGSIVTGYFSYYELENKWGLLWMAPALYTNLLFVCTSGVEFLLNSYAGVNTPRNTSFLGGILIAFLMGLFWYLVSLAGVRLGYFLRERIVRWWYGD